MLEIFITIKINYCSKQQVRPTYSGHGYKFIVNFKILYIMSQNISNKIVPFTHGTLEIMRNSLATRQARRQLATI